MVLWMLLHSEDHKPQSGKCDYVKTNVWVSVCLRLNYEWHNCTDTSCYQGAQREKAMSPVHIQLTTSAQAKWCRLSVAACWNRNKAKTFGSCTPREKKSYNYAQHVQRRLYLGPFTAMEGGHVYLITSHGGTTWALGGKLVLFYIVCIIDI